MRIFIWCCLTYSLIFLQSSALQAQGIANEVVTEPAANESPNEITSPTTTFYQHLDVKRSPQFMVQGLKTSQQIHYQVASSFQIYAPDSERYRKVVQTINDTKLVKADAMSQAVFAKSLAAMKGKTLTYKATETGEVLSVKGHTPNTQAIDIAEPDSKGMMISTVMDEDGWKELAQLTLFQPPETKSSKPFIRRTTHDWGNLGSWYGETQFKRAKGRSKQAKKYEYRHKLTYNPPTKTKDAPAISMMGLTVENAKFRMQSGSGEILYDRKHGHVTSVREVFHARGNVATKMLGTAATIGIDEKQVFTIKVAGYQTSKEKPVPFSPSAERE